MLESRVALHDILSHVRISRRGLIKAGAVGALGAAAGLPLSSRISRVSADGSSFQFDRSKPPLSCPELAFSSGDGDVVQPLSVTYPRVRLICFPGQDTSKVVDGTYTVNGADWTLDSNIKLLAQSERDFWGYFLNVQFPEDDQFFPTTNQRIIMMDHDINYYQNYYPTAFNQEVISKLDFPTTFNTNGYNAYYGIVLPNNTGDPPPYYYQSQSAVYIRSVSGSNRFLGFSCLSGQLINYMVNNFLQEAYLAFNYETAHLFGYPDGHTADGVPINEIYNYDTYANGQLKYLDRFNGNCLSPTPTPIKDLPHKVYLPNIHT